MVKKTALPLPPHFDLANADQIYEPNFNDLTLAARAWRTQHGITPACQDKFRICALGIDFQNTFCQRFTHPRSTSNQQFGELFVGGQNGNGAIEDSIRWTKFMYEYMHVITKQKFSLDTHRAYQIFCETLLENDLGEHPNALFCPQIPLKDIQQGKWKVSKEFAHAMAEFGISYAALQAHLEHYMTELEKKGKYALTIWSYHAELGSIGHALVSIIMEAARFHSIARSVLTDFEIKGGNILTENYSVLSPEVLTGPGGQPIAQRNTSFIKALLEFDAVIIGGQAKSHCVAWTIDDLLTDIQGMDPELAKKVYLLADTTSPVVIPGVIDFTDEANRAFERFAAAGMHIVTTDTAPWDWSGIKL